MVFGCILVSEQSDEVQSAHRDCTHCVVERGQLGADDLISLTRVTRSRRALPQHTERDQSLLERELAPSTIIHITYVKLNICIPTVKTVVFRKYLSVCTSVASSSVLPLNQF